MGMAAGRRHHGLPRDATATLEEFGFFSRTISALHGLGDLEEFGFAEVGAEDLQADREVDAAVEVGGAAGHGDVGEVGADRDLRRRNSLAQHGIVC